jgi:hypothetical protein
MATEKIQELADEYGIPTEVVEEYIEYMGFDADEVDSLNYYGTFKNESDFAEQLVDEGVITDLGRYLYMTSTDMHILAGEEADNRVDNMDDEEVLEETGDSYSPDEVDEAREYLHRQYYDEIHEELEKDAVGYFVDRFGYREEDLVNQSIFSVDYDKLGETLEYDYTYITHDGDVYVFNNYKRGGMTYRGGGIVTNLEDAFGSDDLKDELKSKMKEGDTIVAFAYTDYGGDFFDKVAIEYFKEHHPENIVVERTAYNGQNGIVFGEPASEFLEAYESYLLGYENMEEYYYQMEGEQTEDDFEFFLRDLSSYGGYKVSERAMEWLLENKGGYYSMTTQGLDFSSSDLERELLEEGLIKKQDDDDDDDEFTDEENYAKGGVHKVNKKYAYFAVNKKTNKIIDGWEIVDDVESLKYYAKMDLKDNDLNPSDYNLLSAKTLKARGIDPYSWDSWAKTGEYADGGMMAKGGEVRYKLKGRNFGEEIENGQKFKELISKVYNNQSGESKYPENFIKETAFTTKIVKNKDDNTYWAKDYMYNGTLSKFTFLDDENFLKALALVDRPAIRKMADGGMMAKGGAIEHGLKVGDTIVNAPKNSTMITIKNDGEKFAVNLNDGKRSQISSDYGKGGVTFDDKVNAISRSLMERKKVSPSVQKDYGKTYSRKEAIDSAKRIAGAMRKKEMSKGGYVIRTRDKLIADDVLKYADLQKIPASYRKVGNYYSIRLDDKIKAMDSMTKKFKNEVYPQLANYKKKA